MAEVSPEVKGIQPPPTFIGAVFETGRSRGMIHDWTTNVDLVPVVDVKDKDGRDIWLFENMCVFNNGTVASPELSWKGIIDFHIAELKVAAKNADLEKDVRIEDFRKEIEKTEKYLKAAMAVSSSARAMEASSGVPKAYTIYITQSSPPNPDRQDSWAEFLLHKDPKKIQTVLGNEIVNYFYKKIIDDVGMGEVLERDEDDNLKFDEKGRFIVNWDKFDAQKALEGQLIGFLIDKIPSPLNKDEKWKTEWENKHLVLDEEREKLDEDGKPKKVGKKWKNKSSLYDYIWEILLDKENIKKLGKEDKDIPLLWSAARLAADIFLVDKFTKWDHELSQIFLKENLPRNKPSKGWGGDPLKTILEPSFLPRQVKGVYAKDDAGKAITGMINLAFRPEDLKYTYKVRDKNGNVIREEEAELKDVIDKKLPCSMTCPLKSFDRYNDALWGFLGEGSRAPGVAKWDRDAMEKYLPLIVEKLDDVYGKFESEDKKNDKTLGGELMGKIMARVILCKSLAAAYASARPGLKDAMNIIFGEAKMRPFYEVKQFLWGPRTDGKSGFIRDLVGPRTRFKFAPDDNRFNSIEDLQVAWNLLTSSDQDDLAGKRIKLWNTVGFIVNSLAVLAPAKKGR